jgi:predicted metalloprotease
MLKDGRESGNIEDVRGMGGKGLAIGGGGLGLIITLVYVLFCGGDPQMLLDQITGSGQPAQVEQQRQTQPQSNQQADAQKKEVSVVLATTEDAWRVILPQQANRKYQDPTLVLFSNAVNSACGRAGSSTGPFYCPADQKLYLDFGFFTELAREFKAPGDFAQAYVIAHEVGHHVQNLVGTMSKVTALQQRLPEAQANQLSVGLELQADCYAGVWGNYVQKQGKLEVGDVEEAIRAAGAVGDDAIQKRSQGYVVPESFTHGSAQDRMSWFNKGFQSGDMRQCNTFSNVRGL